MPAFITDWKFPGTALGNRFRAGSDADWVNADNIKLDDGSNATVTLLNSGDGSAGLAAQNFDFSEIPAGATINGIEIRIGDYIADVDSGQTDWNILSLIKPTGADGNQTRENNPANPTTSNQSHDEGGLGDLWLETLSVANVQDADFGFFLAFDLTATVTTVFGVDFMQMRVFYRTSFPILVGLGTSERGWHPPFKSSAGAFYIIMGNATGPTTLEAFKATEPHYQTGWSIQDGGNNPFHSAQYTHTHTVQDGDLIHIATIDSVIGFPDDRSYHQFNMATDLWVVTDELIERPADAAYSLRDVSIAVRDDGSPVAFYKGDPDKNMGNFKDRIDVNVRVSGTWGGPIGVDAGGDIHYGNPMIIKSLITDEMHLFFQRTTNTDDPPLTRQDIQARTLRADDSLSGVDTDTQDTDIHLHGYRNPLIWDDAGSQKILTHGINGASGGARHYMPCTVDGSDDVVLGTAVADTAGADGKVNAVNGGEVSAIVRDEFGIIHQVYAGGGTDGIDSDLYYTKSDDDGATWDTPIEIRDNQNINNLSANIYVRGCNIVLAMVYSNGEAAGRFYDEYVLYSWECKPVEQLSYKTKSR